LDFKSQGIVRKPAGAGAGRLHQLLLVALSPKSQKRRLRRVPFTLNYDIMAGKKALAQLEEGNIHALKYRNV
jgi:hypothetical protein